VTVVSTHLMKAIATERIADLQQGAAARPEETPKARRRRRFKRSAMRTRVATVRPEQP